MHVRLTMTGPDAGSIRVAVKKELAKLDATAEWTLEMETTPIFRAEGEGEPSLDWKCEVVAWDGRETAPPPHLWAVEDEEI